MVRWLRVLIVSQDDRDAEAIASALCRGGYTPLWQCVGTAAAIEASIANARWDVIMCSDVVPSLGTAAAVRMLRRLAPGTPVLIVAGEGGEAQSAILAEAGAFGLVSKRRIDALADLVVAAVGHR